MSRIDLLPLSTKRVLQTASVLGPAFRSDLLSATLREGDRANCSEHLTRLVDAGFLINSVDAGSFEFRHALSQEVAYSNLLVARRQVIHEQTGLAMETIHQATTANAGEGGGSQATPFDVGLIAYHFSQSANREKELFYAEKAADFSVRKGAYSEAYAYVARALELVSALPSSPERNTRELVLSLAAGSVLLVLPGQGSVEAREAYDRALGLCGAIGDSPEVGRGLFGIFTYFLFHGLMREAEEAVQKIVRLADATGDPGYQDHGPVGRRPDLSVDGRLEPVPFPRPGRRFALRAGKTLHLHHPICPKSTIHGNALPFFGELGARAVRNSHEDGLRGDRRSQTIEP